jgi:hypothetical protein
MADRAERRAARAERLRARQDRRRQPLRERVGRRRGGRTAPEVESLMAREMSNEEFDADDLFDVEGDPEACFHCGRSTNTVSLAFEARLHRTCADAAWAAYFRAMRG